MLGNQSSSRPDRISSCLHKHYGKNLIFFQKGDAIFFLSFILLQHLRTQYDELFPALCDDHPDTFPRELYTWEQFLWACELWYSNSMKVMFPDGKLKTCLIPIAGFLNHSVR